MIHDSIINEINETEEMNKTNINDKNDELRNVILTWAISHNITQNTCNDLLRIFRQYTLYI